MPIKNLLQVAKAQAENKETSCKALLLFVEQQINAKLEKEAPTDCEDTKDEEGNAFPDDRGYYSFDIGMFEHRDFLLYWEDGLSEMVVRAIEEAGYKSATAEVVDKQLAIKVKFFLSAEQMLELQEARERELQAFQKLEKKRAAQQA